MIIFSMNGTNYRVLELDMRPMFLFSSNLKPMTSCNENNQTRSVTCFQLPDETQEILMHLMIVG